MPSGPSSPIALLADRALAHDPAPPISPPCSRILHHVRIHRAHLYLREFCAGARAPLFARADGPRPSSISVRRLPSVTDAVCRQDVATIWHTAGDMGRLLAVAAIGPDT